MTDWTAGYVADVEYMPGFYAEQMPAHLDAACLIRATEPPVAPGEPFNYCELGCGVGETAMVVAATNPQACVWGFDFNPAHIARGQALARAGGLDNLTLEERSFEELAGPDAPDLPPFHYVTLHGVWSWISAENRAHIVAFLKKRLAPGGVVCVTYNALPAWAGVIPLQRLLLSVARHIPDRSDRRIGEVIGLARRMTAAGAPAFDVKLVDNLEKELSAGNVAYLAHEYLNAHWSPAFQGDVAAALSEAKLGFAATANIFENFPQLCLKPEQRAIIDGMPAEMRETLRDYFMVRSFRRDIYVRGSRPISPRRLAERQRRQRLALVVPPDAVTLAIKVPLGEAELHERFYRPAFGALSGGVLSVGDLIDAAAPGSAPSAGEVIGMMLGSRQAMAAAHADPAADALARVRAFNLAHLRACAEEGRAVTALVGAGIGSAVTVRLFEMLTYEALASGAPPEAQAVADAAWTLLAARGDRLREEGRVVESEAEAQSMLSTNVAAVLGAALPMWRRIGAI